MIFRSQNVICKWFVLHGLVGFMEGDSPFCDPQINKCGGGALKKNTMQIAKLRGSTKVNQV
jgi:hypothetical protein